MVEPNILKRKGRVEFGRWAEFNQRPLFAIVYITMKLHYKLNYANKN
jgi:hypothetical protein